MIARQVGDIIAITIEATECWIWDGGNVQGPFRAIAHALSQDRPVNDCKTWWLVMTPGPMPDGFSRWMEDDSVFFTRESADKWQDENERIERQAIGISMND